MLNSECAEDRKLTSLLLLFKKIVEAEDVAIQGGVVNIKGRWFPVFDLPDNISMLFDLPHRAAHFIKSFYM